MTTRSAVLSLILIAICIGSVGCGKSPETAVPVTSSANKPLEKPEQKSEGKYAGAWRTKGSTILIKQEGAGFIIETEGPAGTKDVGTIDNGVMRFGTQTALYTPSSDQLIFAGKEFKRIDSRQQTLRDLEAVRPAVEMYARDNKMPPATEPDFFYFIPNYFPDMVKEDGWGTRFRYLCKIGQPHWAVVSAGPDGMFDPRITAESIAWGYGGTKSDDLVLTDAGLDPDLPR